MNPQPPRPTSEEIEASFVWGLLEIKQEKEKKHENQKNN